MIMKIEAQPTTSTTAEAVQAKAEARLLLARLLDALVQARQCIDADEVIGAHAIITAALGEKG